MSYLKINGSDEHYNVELQPFTTQHGYRGVKFVGDVIPSTDQGFKMYSDDDEEIADLSAFTHEYNPNSYSVEEDIIENPSPNNEPCGPSALDRINARINALSSNVNEITPYTDSKLVGIQDMECIFQNVTKDGSLTANLKTDSGLFLPCEVARVDTNVRVTFDKLEEVATVTISIQ